MEKTAPGGKLTAAVIFHGVREKGEPQDGGNPSEDKEEPL